MGYIFPLIKAGYGTLVEWKTVLKGQDVIDCYTALGAYNDIDTRNAEIERKKFKKR